jgi:hypothetical protein
MDSMNQVCPFAGNSDLYGIGVRVGLYAQWAATLLVTLFSPEDEETFRIVNIIIQSAVFLGICSQSSKYGRIQLSSVSGYSISSHIFRRQAKLNYFAPFVLEAFRKG